jgi:uncharacterized protein YdeI (YjbR/CyaY-like superfamily)
MSTELPIRSFASAEAFERWLRAHHVGAAGVWVRFFKKGSTKKTVTYGGALDVALCFGWIDSQVKKHDDVSYLQKFTPRGPRSIWSKRNRDHVARLVKEGRMQPAGLAAVDAAKRDGRWDQAYDSPKNMEVPPDFVAALAKNKKAETFFATLNRANVYAIAWRLQTAKKLETRAKRIRDIVAKLARGEAFHPQKRPST